MIEIDCHELTVDEQIALAAAISDGLVGKALAFVKGTKVVLDSMSNPGPEPREVETIVGTSYRGVRMHSTTRSKCTNAIS